MCWILARGLFGEQAFDLIGVDAETLELLQAGFAMGAGGGGVAALIVMLAVQFCFIALASVLGRPVDRGEEHVGCPADLLHRQQLAAGHLVGGRQLLTNPRAEQSAENRDVQMPMDAPPAAALEVVPAELFLHFAEAGFHLAAPKRHPQEVAQRPAVSSGYAVAEEVFRLAGQHVAGDNQRPLATDQAAGVRLAPTGVPLDFPDLRAVAGVFDAILLCLLLAEARRVPGQILNFTGRSLAARQAWIFRVAACFPLVFRLLSQHDRLGKPDVKVGRHLAHERFAAFVESVQELAVAAV